MASDRKGKKNDEVNKTNYLKGLKRCQNQGASIIIDGERIPEQEWEKIFEVREDNSFYMADYITDEKTGKIREIRFDRVYNR